MKILWICNVETASACIMYDGEIVFAATEERFLGVKLLLLSKQKATGSRGDHLDYVTLSVSRAEAS